MQDVLLVVVVAIAEGRYRPEPDVDHRRALRAWLTTIARNLAGRFLRLSRVRLEVVTEPGCLPEDQSGDPMAALDARERVRLLGHLRSERRVILEAVMVGERVSEMARVLGTPKTTVWTRLRLGRRDLRKALRQTGAR